MGFLTSILKSKQQCLESPEHRIARELLLRIIPEVDNNFPPQDDACNVYGRWDASEVYGPGWYFRLKVYWGKCIGKYMLEIEVLQLKLGYKSSVVIMAGTQHEIMNKFHSETFILELEEIIPKIKTSLEEAMRDYR